MHMQYTGISKALLWCVRIGIWLLLFTPLIVAPTWFFPYITGKNFFFRIVTELVFGAWLALILIDAQFRPRRGIVLWAFLSFVAILGLATMFGADPYHSFWSNFERMEGMVTYLHLAALFLMASSVFRTVSDWRLTFHVSLAVSFIVAGYGLLELFKIIEIPGSTAGVTGIGIFSRLGNQIYLAAYLLFHFFILGFLFFTTRNIWWRALYMFLGLFELYIFFHTGTRGALIGLAVGLAVVVFALFLFSLRDNKRLALYMGVLIALGVGTIAGLYMLRDSAVAMKYPLLRRFADINLQSSTAQSRIMIWGIANEAVKERPLLGWGPDNFILPYGKYYNPNLFGNEPWFDRVHNMHFEWLVDAGILGFLAYLTVIGSSLYGLWTLWRRRALHNVAIAVLAGFLAAYLAQNTFVFDNIITYLFFVLFLALVQSMSASMSIRNSDKEIPQNNIPSQKRGGYAFILAPFCIVVGIVVAATVHTKQMQVASGIIDMLNSASMANTALSFTNKVDAMVAKNTFGTSEVRERFVDFLFAAARPHTQVATSDLLLLLSHGIDEIKKESERNPDAIRSSISLGKLLQLRYTVSGSHADRDEAIKVYEKVIALAPHYPSTYIGLAEVYLVNGDTKRASDVMDDIFQEMSRPNTFIYSLLSVSILDGDWERAARQIQRFKSFGNTPAYPAPAYLEPEKLDEVVKRTFTINDPHGREKFLKILLEAQEESVTLLGLAETATELGKWDEVDAYLSRAHAVARPNQRSGVDEFEKQLRETVSKQSAPAGSE